MGKSSSGKDTIYNILKNRLDVNSYVMYTTRPKRTEEVEGVSYNFITQDEMDEFISGKKKDKLLEFRTYQTVYGPWTYATINDEQFESTKDLLMLGTLVSYKNIKDKFMNNKDIQLVPVYIQVSDNVRLKRAVEREEKQSEPKYVELCRRFIADSEDFSEDNLNSAGIIKRFDNIDLDLCVKEIEEYLQ